MKQRPRLCFVGWGNHVHVERWAGWFAREGYDVCVISMGKPGRYPPGVRQAATGRVAAWWLHWTLRWLLWRFAPDVVHVHWAHFAVPVRRAWRGPLVVTAWGSDVYRREAFSDRDWLALGNALRAADRLTCDSIDLAARIETEFALPARRIQVIQWGVDLALFAPRGPDLRESLGLAGKEVVFSARNFTPLYNQHRIVEAFAVVAAQRPRAFLLMKNYRGDAAVLAAVRADIEARGLTKRVRILDEVPYERMPALYRSADVMVSIPDSDAAPMSVLEAMACGCAVVASDLPSLREWIDPGRSGLLVDPGDADALSRALLALLGDAQRRRALADAALAHVERAASQRAHMAVAAACYEELGRRATARSAQGRAAEAPSLRASDDQ